MVDVSPSSHPSSTPDFRLYPVDADAKYTQSPSAATPAFYAFYAFYTPPPSLLLPPGGLPFLAYHELLINCFN